MKILEVVKLIQAGEFVKSKAWQKTRRGLHEAIRSVDWPPGSGTFTIYPQSGKKRGEGNGVGPIKLGLMRRLQAEGWKLEEKLKIGNDETEKVPTAGGDVEVASKPGKLDAVLYTSMAPWPWNGKQATSPPVIGLSTRWRSAF